MKYFSSFNLKAIYRSLAWLSPINKIFVFTYSWGADLTVHTVGSGGPGLGSGFQAGIQVNAPRHNRTHYVCTVFFQTKSMYFYSKVLHETSKREVYEDVKLFTSYKFFIRSFKSPPKKTFIKLNFLDNRLFHFSKPFWEILSLGKAQSCQKPTVIILNKSSFSEFVFFSWINNLTINFGK